VNLVSNVLIVVILALASPPVESAPSELVLTSIQGNGFEVRDWLTSFPLLMVAIDPYTHESAWILETAGRLMEHYAPADVRVGWLATADPDGCREFLGPWSESLLTLVDEDRSVVSALGIERLPALVHIRPDLGMQVADGWDPQEWRAICKDLGVYLDWSTPLLPQPGDPLRYSGRPAS